MIYSFKHSLCFGDGQNKIRFRLFSITNRLFLLNDMFKKYVFERIFLTVSTIDFRDNWVNHEIMI